MNLPRFASIALLSTALVACGLQGTDNEKDDQAEQATTDQETKARSMQGGYDDPRTAAEPEASLSDGKLSLASIDPGTGGLLSVGNLWNAFIAGLVLFFIYSIVEQVALSTQAANDADELEALEEKLMADETAGGKRKAK